VTAVVAYLSTGLQGLRKTTSNIRIEGLQAENEMQEAC